MEEKPSLNTSEKLLISIDSRVQALSTLDGQARQDSLTQIYASMAILDHLGANRADSTQKYLAKINKELGKTPGKPKEKRIKNHSRGQKKLGIKAKVALGFGAAAVGVGATGAGGLVIAAEQGRNATVARPEFSSVNKNQTEIARTHIRAYVPGMPALQDIPLPHLESEALPTPTAAVTTTPALEAKPVETKVGSENFAEFFLGDMVQKVKQRRLERANFEPGFKDRVFNEFLRSDQVTILVLGTDETRERDQNGDFTGVGGGRSDVIQLISFNPHNLRLSAISIPRDLYSPELTHFVNSPQYAPLFADGGPRITNLSQLSRVMGNDSFEVARGIIESATGIPIDMAVKFNIDFIQGYTDKETNSYRPGLIDALFPQGLAVEVEQDILDQEYPKGYGVETVQFSKGKYTLSGPEITKYARSRHGTSDFDRSRRQRQVLASGVGVFLMDALNFIKDGDTTKLDLLVKFLEREKDAGNYYEFERSLGADLNTIKEALSKLRSTPQGQGVLLALAANSADEVKDLAMNRQASVSSFGFDREHNKMVANVTPQDQNIDTLKYPHLLKPTGSITSGQPGKGGYLNYWDPLRGKARELVKGLQV